MSNISVRKTSPLQGKKFDMALAAIGYEKRARYFTESFNPRCAIGLAPAFSTNKELSYSSNYKFFEKRGYLCDEVEDGNFEFWLVDKMSEWLDREESLQICVDITSFSRFRIGVIVGEFMRQASLGKRVVAEFMYSLGSYSAPLGTKIPIRSLGPVTPYFAGWARDPNQPPVAIVGLGYEQDRAMGAVEYIQPGEIWLFLPLSNEDKYWASMASANRILLEEFQRNSLIYNVEEPEEIYARLESLVFRKLTVVGNVILLPFGPKMFFLISLAVACSHRAISVWRVSANDAEVPANRIASGKVIGFEMTF